MLYHSHPSPDLLKAHLFSEFEKRPDASFYRDSKKDYAQKLTSSINEGKKGCEVQRKTGKGEKLIG
jgi:hypothetical protein